MKDLGEILEDAEALKENIWQWMAEKPVKHPKLKDTMNLLLDYLEDFIEIDKPND